MLSSRIWVDLWKSPLQGWPLWPYCCLPDGLDPVNHLVAPRGCWDCISCTPLKYVQREELNFALDGAWGAQCAQAQFIGCQSGLLWILRSFMPLRVLYLLWVKNAGNIIYIYIYIHAYTIYIYIYIYILYIYIYIYICMTRVYRVIPGSRNHGFWPSQRVSKHTLIKSATQPASVVSINH